MLFSPSICDTPDDVRKLRDNYPATIAQLLEKGSIEVADIIENGGIVVLSISPLYIGTGSTSLFRLARTAPFN